MPMLIMRSVPPSETGASNGLNALSRSLGTSTAGAVVGVVLAGMSTTYEGVQVPTAGAFQMSFVLGIAAAGVALVLALFIPSRPSASERHPSLPEQIGRAHVELQSLMRISYAVFCLNKKHERSNNTHTTHPQ